MNSPQPDEWLASFNETGQTFGEYLNENPNKPTAERNILYVQPLGKLNGQEMQILNKTAEFLHLFYNLPVKLLPEKNFLLPLQLKNRRLNPFGVNEQVKTGFILNELLLPDLPNDAAALIAFTNLDLFPDQNFAFVFGQASLENRIGVWSLYRLHEHADQTKFLLRTLKIAAHETGHIFSIRHCTKYSCVMNGANHLGETDKHPLDSCPECTAKILWLTDADVRQRYLELEKFCLQNGLRAEAQSFQKKADSVK